MNKLFHHGYFKEMFRQLKVAGIVSAVILMLSNFVTLVTIITQYLSEMYLDSTVSPIPDGMSIAMPMMSYVYIVSFILTFTAYNWLNRRSYSDFYHGLPIKRSQMYFSSFVAIMLWIFIGLTAYAVVQAILHAVFGTPYNYLLLLCVYLNMLIGAIEVVGAVSIACAISGTRFVNLITSVVIIFIPRFMLTVLAVFIHSLTNGFFFIGKLSILFDPSYNIFGTPYAFLTGFFLQGASITFGNVWAMLYSLAYSLLLVILGCIAFVKRRSELAGMPASNKLMQILIRTAIALPLLLLLVFYIVQVNFSLIVTVVLVLFSFIFYCLYELISTRNVKKMLKAIPLYVIPLGIAILYFVLPHAVKAAELSRKAATNNVKGYYVLQEQPISLFGIYNTSKSYQDIIGSKIEFTDPESIQIITKAYERNVNQVKKGEESSPIYTMNVRIDRKLGRDIYCELSLLGSEYYKLQSLQKENAEFMNCNTAFPTGRRFYSIKGLNLREKRELVKLFEDEFNSLGIEDKLKIMENDSGYDYLMPEFVSDVNLYISGCKGTENYTTSFKINEKTPRTYKRYMEICNAKYGEKIKENINEMIYWTEHGGDMPDFTIYFETVYSMSNISAWDFVDGYDEGEKLPKDASPNLYEALKILAGAELCDDPEKCKTIKTEEYIAGYTLSEEDLFRLSRLRKGYE